MSTRDTIARPIAAEDIRAGMFIAVLYEITQPCRWCIDDALGVRAGKLELPWGVEPFQVQAVCLPYVLVRKADDETETIDVRRHRIARLSGDFGRVAFAQRRKKVDETDADA